MDRATVEVYEQGAATYRAERSAYRPERAVDFAAAIPSGLLRLDLGCGPGLYLPLLGKPVIAADAAHAMLRQVAEHSPATSAVQCDLLALPFADASFAGIWASKAHQHLAAGNLPAAFAELHRVMPVGGRLELTMFATDQSEPYKTSYSGPSDSFPGRLFTFWQPDVITDLFVGAGFEDIDLEVAGDEPRRIELAARRGRSLADSVDANMALLICGLNPSLYAADAGVGFARPGNRFWPALQQAGIGAIDRNPSKLLRNDHIGMTDLVKRSTVAADELSRDEYRNGLARVTRLCTLLKPAVICFVGLAGWRAVVDRRAQVGWQPERLGDTPVYVMASTSGLNARTRVEEHARHLRAAHTGQES